MQNFDVVDIEKRRRHPESAEIDVVNQEAHRWIGSALILLQLADAANLEIARQRGIAGPIEVRDQARTSSKFCCPASRSVEESNTEALPGN